MHTHKFNWTAVEKNMDFSICKNRTDLEMEMAIKRKNGDLLSKQT